MAVKIIFSFLWQKNIFSENFIVVTVLSFLQNVHLRSLVVRNRTKGSWYSIKEIN